MNLKKITSKFDRLHLTLALNYGSRNEILNALRVLNQKNSKNIKEEDISKNLMTSDLPDPDFVIRTSGEKRLSNFLLWQIAYSELYFTKTLWPDFSPHKYISALKNYISRKRRFGGD
jgi:undecaprenyl diphosphate synthase